MKTTIIAQFEIPYFRYLNPQGDIEQPLPEFAQDQQHLAALYRMMVLTRIFDKKAIALQRTGKLGTYPSQLGQEAIGVGIGAAMREDDILAPYYRECGAQFWRKVRMEEILLYWGGDERGSNYLNNPHDFPTCVPIASQTLHAVGAATAVKYLGKDKVVVATVGDGGTSRGDFYEAMNVAGVWELPIVFVINNNQWAISVPRSKQCKAATLAQKGIAAGLPGIQIDGNDIIAVRDAVGTAIQKAREGKGATVIEAMTYRMGDHTTADDAGRYRSKEELALHEKLDPVNRFKEYLFKSNQWDQEKENALVESVTNEVNKAVDNFLTIPPQAPESIFDYLYETLPDAYMAQRAAVMGEKV